VEWPSLCSDVLKAVVAPRKAQHRQEGDCRVRAEYAVYCFTRAYRGSDGQAQHLLYSARCCTSGFGAAGGI